MRKIIKIVFLLTLILGWSNATMAIPLSDLLSGNSITVGDKIFSDWDTDVFNFFGDPLATPNLDPTLVDVMGDATDPDNIGLLFTSLDPFAVSLMGNGNFTFNLKFTVTVDGPDLIKDNSLGLLDWEFVNTPSVGAATIEISEIVRDPFLNVIGDKYVRVDDFGDPASYILEDSAIFTPLPSIQVEKIFHITNEFGGGEVFLTEFSQYFSQESGTSVIPEPGTILLIGFGLLGIAGISRRRA